MPTFADVRAQLAQGKLQRILAFGSSNTARRIPGMHWFDCVDLALSQTVGRQHRCINTGIGGHSAQQLLERYEQDAAFYKPHAVFITIGGNDAVIAKNFSAQVFRDNLVELHRKFTELNTAVIFQTYYAPNVFQDGMTPYLTKFYEFMDIVREVASETGAELIDHLARWEPFRKKHPAMFIQLMLDVMHVNEQGNLILGLDIARKLELSLHTGSDPYWSFARQCQAEMDAIEQGL